MSNPKLTSQWRKRLNVVEAIFADLIFAYEKKDCQERVIAFYNWSDFEKKILFYYLENKLRLQQEIGSFLKSGWTLDRLCKTTTAILLEAVAEYDIHQTHMKVLIQQAIISAQRISEYTDYKMVNAILDNYFKQK